MPFYPLIFSRKYFACLNSTTLERVWEENRFDLTFLQKDPMGAQFLYDTRLIFLIIQLQNSTTHGKKHHSIGFLDKKIAILKEGKLCSLTEICKTLFWDPQENAFFHKERPNERWNYMENGLTPEIGEGSNSLRGCPITFSEIQPIASINDEEMEVILENAERFYSDKIQKKESFSAVLQIVNHLPSNYDMPLIKEMQMQTSVFHCGLRIIFNKKVYSSGLGVTNSQLKLLSQIRNHLTSVHGTVFNLDICDNPLNSINEKYYSYQVTTSIPLTEAQAQRILDILNQARSFGIRFNVLEQNCQFFAAQILKLLNINVDTRISFDTFVSRLIPKIPEKSWIYRSFEYLKSTKAFQVFKRLDWIFQIVFSPIRELSYRCKLIFKNSILYILGSHRGTPTNSSLQTTFQSADSFWRANFKTFFNIAPTSFLDQNSGSIFHPSVMIHWQLSKPSTYAFRRDRNYHFLPPQTREEKQNSSKEIERLKDQYADCLPDDPRLFLANKS